MIIVDTRSGEYLSGKRVTTAPPASRRRRNRTAATQWVYVLPKGVRARMSASWAKKIGRIITAGRARRKSCLTHVFSRMDRSELREIGGGGRRNPAPRHRRILLGEAEGAARAEAHLEANKMIRQGGAPFTRAQDTPPKGAECSTSAI